MKIRTDFVTNSSSSSFIVAVKKGISLNEIEQYANALMPDFTEYVEKYKYNANPNELRNQLVSFLSEVLEDGMDLEVWKVSSITVYNDSGCFYAYLYDNWLEDNDWLRTALIF